MQAIVTKPLLEAIERAAKAARDDAVQMRHSADYEASTGQVNRILHEYVEQNQQDYDAIMGWLERTKEENKPKG